MNRMPLTDDDRVFLDKLRIASPEDELRIYEHHQPTAQEVASKIVDHMLENGKRGIRPRGWYALPYSVREGIVWLGLFAGAGLLAVWIVCKLAPWIDGVAR